jgi:ATP-dependent Lon protease
MVMHFDAAREKTINAVERAVKGDGYVFLAAQQELDVDNPTEKDLFKVGVVAEIKQILKLPDNVVKVLVEGMYRAEMTSLIDEGDVLLAQVKRVPTYSRVKYNELEAEALVRTVKDIFERYTSFFPKIPREMLSAVMAQSNPVKLFEAVCFNSNINYRDKQELLEETSIIKKLTLLVQFLSAEVEILELENEINEQT